MPCSEPLLPNTATKKSEEVLMSQGSKIYLEHIDGIRALAVIAVLLFHFGIHGLAAGFIGVDIFCN